MYFSKLATIDNNLPSTNVPDTVFNSPLPAFLKLDSQTQCISRKKRGKQNARGSWFVTVIGFHSVRILSIYNTVSYPCPYTLLVTGHSKVLHKINVCIIELITHELPLEESVLY